MSANIHSEDHEPDSVYYVGIGASAGGLEALQEFFKAMPNDTGMIFIIIQHLSPDYKSLMDELLARHTKMKIVIATDGLETVPNTVYLIPPRKNLSILHGKLYLEDQKKRSLNLPIDIFFRSLAADKERNAIGVILSGTGSDGTLGIRAIKEAGGMAMVQDDQSAKFDGMPRNSIATGLVDMILPPSKMPEALINYIKHPLIKPNNVLNDIMSNNVDSFSKIILILRDYCGIDFSYYKESTIIRRLERRLGINRFETLQEYILFLSESEKEKETLFRELLIGVTRFFRDQEAFDAILSTVLPKLSYSKKTLRIWSAGCSTGEEVYSLAILLQEYIDANKLDCTFKIFATDIDRYALELAGQGYYPESIVSDVEPGLLAKHFSRKGNGYLINENIRKTIVFASHNLLKDPPFSKLDLLVCRNLFIYLKPEMQQRILAMFYFSLNENGFLFMGSSESIGELNEAFTTIDAKWKIYQPKANYKSPLLTELSLLKPNIRDKDELPRGSRKVRGMRVEKVMESVASAVLPPSLLLDNNDSIVHIINDISPFIKFRTGIFSQNIFSNVNPDLSPFINSLLRKLKTHKKEVVMESITNINGFNEQKITLKGNVLFIESNELYLISFILNSLQPSEQQVYPYVVNMSQDVQERIHDLERDLNNTKETLQATVEELETSNEELQSSNEELIASNEELQSTNEELQSVNEELYTVNSEYQSKIEELTRLTGDLDNLLKNTEIGALYLDRKLCIRKITSVVTKITNILPSDIGRPISHIAVMDYYKELLNDIEQVIETLKMVEKEITSPDGKVWLTSILPYRAEYNSVDGIMITFMDITKLKKEQKSKKEMEERLEQALQIGHMAWWEWNYKSGKVLFSPLKATMLGYTMEEFPDSVEGICALIHAEDYEKTMEEMRHHLQGKTEYWNTIYRIRRKDGGYAYYHDRGKITERDPEGKPLKLIGTVIDVTVIKELEAKLNRDAK